MTPTVSVVIPNYNLGRFVGEAIDSVLAQTYREIEIIVVDDGSTDDSTALLRGLPVWKGSDAQRIHLIEQANGGVANARNRGAGEARGEYLVFLDADDLLEDRYVEACLAALSTAPSGVAYAYTHMRLFGTEEWTFEAHPFKASRLLKHNFVNASAMVRRSAFEHAGRWNPTFRVGYEDHELWVRMLAHGYTGVLVPEVLLLYRRHGPSRNDLRSDQLVALHYDIAVRYPRLYWRELLLQPHHALPAAYRLFRSRATGGAAQTPSA